MTARITRDGQLDPPFWEVQSVFDKDGTTGFAYTVGLHRVGLPELHIRARPSLGDDPGHDWQLSSLDQCDILNHLAVRMLDRQVCVGSTLTREYDGGLATVTYRIDPREDKPALDAGCLPPCVDVLPVRWALVRTPEGKPGPLTACAEEAALATYAEITSGLDRFATAPSGWQPPAEPSLAVDQPYGPLTPVVLARGAQLWQSDDDTICDLLHVAVRVSRAFSLTWAVSRAIALARPVGRRAALERVQDDAWSLVESLTSSPAAQRRWTAVVSRSDPALWARSDQRERSQIERNLAQALHLVTRACVTVETVADVADRDLLLCGRGPWISGLRWQRVPPDREWAAPVVVQDVVRRLLSDLEPATICSVATTHRVLQRENETTGFDRYREVCHHLEAWAVISAAGFPAYPLLSDRAVWKPLLDSPVRASTETIASLLEWATMITSALTHRARLCADDVAVFVAPYSSQLPDLERILNEPL